MNISQCDPESKPCCHAWWAHDVQARKGRLVSGKGVIARKGKGCSLEGVTFRQCRTWGKKNVLHQVTRSIVEGSLWTMNYVGINSGQPFITQIMRSLSKLGDAREMTE